IDVGGGVDVVALGHLIDVGGGAVEGEVEPLGVGEHDHIGEVTAGQGGVELLGDLGVVGAGVDKLDRQVRVLLLEAGDDLQLHVLGATGVVGPPDDGVGRALGGGGIGGIGAGS